ncbi:chloride intracellular channel protein 4-like [Patiria miniata]|uniref:GST C-terminal domain-containing protein n=1 Tax=Patiria miniata TaxID=46514 RepID=A0A914BMD9_PATMI|nr:chloride intracellular channel protein 4-like [Patiria miniata]
MAENSNYDEQGINDAAEEDMQAPTSPDMNDEEEATGQELPESDSGPPAPAPADQTDAAAGGDDSANVEPPTEETKVIKVLKPEDQIRLYVWAGDDLKCLGDDVHCQQIYMILSLKSEVNEMAKFQVITENINIKKSQEFDQLAVNKLPCLVDPVGDRVISDVQTIVDYLEQVFKEPCLKPKKTSLQQVGIDLYRKFTGYLKNTNPNKEDEMRSALNRELEKLNKALKDGGEHRFLDGDHLTQPDLRLLPRLHHVVVAGKIFKGYEIPEDEDKYGRLKQYLENWKQTQVYQETKYSDKDMEYGWYKTRGLDRMYIKVKGGYKLK